LGNLGCRGFPRGWLFLFGTFSCGCPKGLLGPPIQNMGLCSRPGEEPNAWKQFGPEPHANSFVIGPAVIKHTPYSRIGGGGVPSILVVSTLVRDRRCGSEEGGGVGIFLIKCRQSPSTDSFFVGDDKCAIAIGTATTNVPLQLIESMTPSKNSAEFSNLPKTRCPTANTLVPPPRRWSLAVCFITAGPITNGH
jgi:hypothetical protein